MFTPTPTREQYFKWEKKNNTKKNPQSTIFKGFLIATIMIVTQNIYKWKKYVGDKYADMSMALTHQEWVKALYCIILEYSLARFAFL